MWENIFTGENHDIVVDTKMLIRAEFGAGAVLITMGALLGKTNEAQLMTLAIVETFFYCLNEAISIEFLHISDIGGSMVIHTFGAMFGLACTKAFSNANAFKSPN
jgi:ammonium transporter Rh